MSIYYVTNTVTGAGDMTAQSRQHFFTGGICNNPQFYLHLFSFLFSASLKDIKLNKPAIITICCFIFNTDTIIMTIIAQQRGGGNGAIKEYSFFGFTKIEFI